MPRSVVLFALVFWRLGTPETDGRFSGALSAPLRGRLQPFLRPVHTTTVIRSRHVRSEQYSCVQNYSFGRGEAGLINTAGSARVLHIIQYYDYTLYNTAYIIIQYIVNTINRICTEGYHERVPPRVLDRVLYYSTIRVLCMWTGSRIGIQKAYGCRRLEICAWNCLLSSFWPIVLATAHYHSVYTFICNIIYIQAKPYRVPLCLCGLCAG